MRRRARERAHQAAPWPPAAGRRAPDSEAAPKSSCCPLFRPRTSAETACRHSQSGIALTKAAAAAASCNVMSGRSCPSRSSEQLGGAPQLHLHFRPCPRARGCSCSATLPTCYARRPVTGAARGGIKSKRKQRGVFVDASMQSWLTLLPFCRFLCLQRRAQCGTGAKGCAPPLCCVCGDTAEEGEEQEAGKRRLKK